MNKSDWLKIRKSGKLTTQAINFGLLLNPTVDKMTDDQLKFNLNAIQANHYLQEMKIILDEAIRNLDRHFAVQTIVGKQGKVIWVES